METKKIVELILKKCPETRSSDEELLLKYQELYGNDNARSFIENHFSFIQNFIRYRAMIQAKGLYPAKKKVKEYRDKMSEAKRKEFTDYNGRKIKKGK